MRRNIPLAHGALAVVTAAVLALPCSARAQGGILLQGIADAEVWSTNRGSIYLTRNDGRVGPAGRLSLWAAVEPWRGVFLYGASELEVGSARADTSADTFEAEQFGVRIARSPYLTLDLGKMPNPVGAFASRRFSNRNPLIGTPDGYPVQYPLGAVAGGVFRWIDYRAGIVSLAVAHKGYTPEPDKAVSPVMAIGITPMIGVRVGFSGIVAPYLNRSFSPAQLDQRDWSDYQERIGAIDAQVSRGYLELRGEWARSRYDVPRVGIPSQGTTYYGEAKYTFTPRFFVAARYEENNYPFIAAFGTSWTSGDTDFNNTEAGVGFRLTASTLIKASYREDHWVVTPANSAFITPGGHAIGVQLSQSFDVMDLVSRKK